MSENTKVAATPLLTGPTKYRVGTRERLQAAGWTFVQHSATVDEYRDANGTVAHFVHGPKNTMTRAEISDGKGQIEVIGDGQLKLERAIAVLTGTEPAPWYMTDAEVKALPPTGSGSALILTQEQIDARDSGKKASGKASAVAPEAAPVPKPAPRNRRKAPAKTG